MADDRSQLARSCYDAYASGAERIASFEFERLVESGDEVLVTYECTRTDGTRFRNTEVLGCEGDRRKAEVYFGWDLE